MTRFEAALTLMERTGAPPAERGWLSLRCGLLLPYANVAKARAYIAAANALAVTAGDGTLSAYARFQRGQYAAHAGDIAYGVPEMEAGIAEIACLTEEERAHFALLGMEHESLDKRAVMVLWRSHVGRYREAREMGEGLAAEAWYDEWRSHALAATYAILGMQDAAAAMHDHAHDLCLQRGNITLASITTRREIELVALPYLTQEIAYRRRLADRAEAEWAQASDVVPSAFPPRFMRLPLLLLEGQWDEAARLATSASGDAGGNIGSFTNALRHLATLSLLRGDTETAWGVVQTRFPRGSATAPGTVAYFEAAMVVLRVAVALALDAGDLPDARAWLDAHDRWLAWSGAVLGLSEGRALWARYHRQAGDARRARDHAERALAHATEPRQPLALLAAHRLLGELDTGARSYGAAHGHLDAALTLAEACAAPYERALTLLARAELHAAAGEPMGDTLEEVRATLASLGARPALARADALTMRLASVKAASPAYPAGLSAREVDVLRLLTAGRTNQEIADALFLSINTVRAHMTHIFEKTNSDNRAAAAAFAQRHGLAEG